MNAIAQTIQAAQDSEAARKAAAAAAIEMQKEVYADARMRVDKLVKGFNTTPMELQRMQNGPGSLVHPLCSSYGSGQEYAKLGNGLRFFLLWGPNGRTLYLSLNAVCRYAHRLADVAGVIGEARKKFTESNELMTLADAESAINANGCVSDKDYRAMCHITLDGRFARGEVTYDDKTNPDRIFKTPADCITAVVSSYDIAPFVVLKAKKGKKS